MLRTIRARVTWTLIANTLPLFLIACAGRPDGHQAPAATGTVDLPLRAVVGDEVYRLSNVALLVRPSYTWLSASNDPNETVLRASFPAGRHSAELHTWSLERAGANGTFHPVDAQLVSSSSVEFTIFNGTTTTISFQFETDGQIVTVGSGELQVTIDVTRTDAACTPFGNDCPAGSWCPPAALTGAPLACIAEGNVAPGEACSSPLDCVAGSTCLRRGDATTCTELCPSESIGTPCASGGVCQPRGTDYGACLPERPEGAECPLDAAFLPITDRVDAVYDGQRCRVYVTGSNGSVYRHDLWTNVTDVLLETGGRPAGVDLSPSGDRLLIADANSDTGATNRMLLIDLNDETTRELRFQKDFMEGGTFVPVFLDDSRALVTSTFLGSGWAPLREVHLEDGAYSTLASLRQNSMLSPSADRSVVAFAESNISNGQFGRYELASGSFAHGATGWFAYEIAVSRDATQYAVPSYGGLHIYAYTDVFTQLGSIGGSSLGVAYSPSSDRLYASWANGGIEVFDSLTLESVRTVDANPGLEWAGNNALSSGRLRISGDGRLLMATVSGGVKLYPISEP